MIHYRLLLFEITAWKYREDTQCLQRYAEYRMNLYRNLDRRAIHESRQSDVFVKVGVPKE